MQSDSPVAIPYKWEAAPGRPIGEPLPVVEPWTSPLRPPPGVRKAITKPSVSAFGGFEPEPPVTADTELAGKIVKKLNRLRGNSKIAGACFTSDASRVIHQYSERRFAMADADSYSAICRSSDQPSAPQYSTSVDSSVSHQPAFKVSTAAVPSSPCSINSAMPSSHRRLFEDDGDGLEDGDESLPLPGPSDSAWYQPYDHGDETSPPTSVPAQKWQMRRSYGDLLSTFLRHSTSSRSLKHLFLVRTFRKSKTAKQLDFGT